MLGEGDVKCNRKKYMKVGIVYLGAEHKFLKTMWFVCRRGDGSAVLHHYPGKLPLNTKDRLDSHVCFHIIAEDHQTLRYEG